MEASEHRDFTHNSKEIKKWFNKIPRTVRQPKDDEGERGIGNSL